MLLPNEMTNKQKWMTCGIGVGIAVVILLIGMFVSGSKKSELAKVNSDIQKMQTEITNINTEKTNIEQKAKAESMGLDYDRLKNDANIVSSFISTNLNYQDFAEYEKKYKTMSESYPKNENPDLYKFMPNPSDFNEETRKTFNMSCSMERILVGQDVQLIEKEGDVYSYLVQAKVSSTAKDVGVSEVGTVVIRWKTNGEGKMSNIQLTF